MDAFVRRVCVCGRADLPKALCWVRPKHGSLRGTAMGASWKRSFPYVMASTANFAAKFDLSSTGALRQPAAHVGPGQAEVCMPRTSDPGNGRMIIAHLRNLYRLCLAKRVVGQLHPLCADRGLVRWNLRGQYQSVGHRRGNLNLLLETCVALWFRKFQIATTRRSEKRKFSGVRAITHDLAGRHHRKPGKQFRL